MKLNSVYLLHKNQEPERLISYYYEGFGIGSNELFKTNDQDRDHYPEIICEEIPLIKKNQIAKYTREMKSFFVFAEFAAWDKEQKEKIIPDAYSPKVDIYLAPNDIESITTREETRESADEKGKRETILYYDIKSFYHQATRFSDLMIFEEVAWND